MPGVDADLMRPTLRLTLALLVVAVIVFLGRDISRSLDGMTALSAGPSPYFISREALFLYLWAPIAALCASALFMAPGLLLALGAGPRDERFELWLLKGFVLSLFGVPVVAALVQAATGHEMTGSAYVVLLLALCLPGLGMIARQGGAPVLTGRSIDVAVMIGLPFVVLVLMSPKFYWENFNDDGAHSFLNTLLFIGRGIPFWPPGKSSITGYPSTTMMTETFLQTGFVRLFGPYESALRFAYLPGISVLAGVLLAFARGAGGPTRATVALGIAAQLLLFSFVMAFNPSYNLYFADVALPMTREPLIMLGFIGAVLFFADGRYVWMGVVSCLGLLSAPNGLLLMAFFLASCLLLTRPVPLRKIVIAGAISVGIVMLATVAMILLDRIGVTQRGGEFGSESVLRRLRFVTLVDTQRLLFWLLPAGILPGLALLAWRWQDHLSRCLTLTAVIYVLFFYVQAYRILPHHFAPAALLPIIVFWRLRPVAAAPIPALVAGLLGVAAAAWLSWPDTLRLNSHNRAFGQRLALDASIDPFVDPGSLGTYTALMLAAFDPARNGAEAADYYIQELTAAFVYARRPKPEGMLPDYVVRPATDPTAPGEEVIGEAVKGMVLVVRDPAIYARDLKPVNAPVSIARAYRVPRDTIFGRGLHDKTRIIWDLAQIMGLR